MKKTLIIFLLVFTLYGCQKNVSLDAITLFNNGMLAVEVDGKWGYINTKGEIVIQALYDEASAFYDNKAVVLVNDKMQLIDNKGKNLLSKSYDELYRDIEEDRILYSNDEKWGLMNSNGEIITDTLYDYISSFSYGLALVRVGDKYGFMDPSGKMIVSLIYDDAYSFSNGLAAVKKDYRWGFIDTLGIVYINLTFSGVYSFDEHGNARVRSANDNTWGLINKDSKLLILKEFDSISGTGPIYAAKLNQDIMLYKADGIRFNSNVYSREWWIDGYFANLDFEDDDLNFWFNQDGTVNMSAEYEDSDFGYFKVDSKMIPYFAIYDEGFIEIHLEESMYRFEGSKVIQMLEDHQFIIERNDKYGIIDKDKNIMVEFLYDFLYKTDDNYYLFIINDKYGIMDSKYKTIVTATYTRINPNINISWL